MPSFSREARGQIAPAPWSSTQRPTQNRQSNPESRPSVPRCPVLSAEITPANPSDKPGKESARRTSGNTASRTEDPPTRPWPSSPPRPPHRHTNSPADSRNWDCSKWKGHSPRKKRWSNPMRSGGSGAWAWPSPRGRGTWAPRRCTGRGPACRSQCGGSRSRPTRRPCRVWWLATPWRMPRTGKGRWVCPRWPRCRTPAEPFPAAPFWRTIFSVGKAFSKIRRLIPSANSFWNSKKINSTINKKY